MKVLSFSLLLLISTKFLTAQTNLSPMFLVYGDLNLSTANNFEYKETIGGGGDFGVQYKLWPFLSFGAEYNNQIYKKKSDFNSLVVNYLTQMNGVSLVSMIEFPLNTNWKLGFAGKYTTMFFSGRVYSDFEVVYWNANGLTSNRLKEQINIYTGLIQLKRHIYGIVDGQLGLSYNQTTSYYLDMFNPTNQNKADNYLALSGGLTLNFGEKIPKVKIKKVKSRKQKCPKF